MLVQCPCAKTDESIFVRAFSEFSASQLPERVQAVLIKESYARAWGITPAIQLR
jgi:hypothetical protein